MELADLSSSSVVPLAQFQSSSANVAFPTIATPLEFISTRSVLGFCQQRCDMDQVQVVCALPMFHPSDSFPLSLLGVPR